MQIDEPTRRALLDLFRDSQALEAVNVAINHAEKLGVIVTMRELDGPGQIIRVTGQGRLALGLASKE